MTPTSTSGAAPRQAFSVGGIMQVRNLRDLMRDESDAARQRAEAESSKPVVLSLVSQVRNHWMQARDAKRTVERRMLTAMRALRGEYDPDVLQQLKKQGSSEIYMMLFASKARQAKALLGDVVLGSADDKPWALRHTAKPDLPPDLVEQILQGTQQLVLAAEQSPAPLSVQDVRQMLRDAKEHAEASIEQEARVRCSRAEKKLEDLMSEGGLVQALDEFLDDLMVYPTAFLKGPVVRRRGDLEWAEGPGGYVPTVTMKLKPYWERVDPTNIYPAPWSRHVDDGFILERHQLTRQALSELRGVEGYNDDAIASVLVEHATNKLLGWLEIDSARAHAEGRDSTYATHNELIDALQYWGEVTGQLLLDWGMDPEEIEDPAKVYAVEVWLIGNYVIKATINPDPLARRPYYAVSYKKVPGMVWGLSLYETMEDCQRMCNAAARALANNLGISSGPQVWVNVDRLPPGEPVEQIYPWKVTQTTSDPTGSTAAPMGFFQPSSNGAELMGVFEKFSQLADEYTGIPRYMTGDGAAGGAGRTASGMSMMVNNAGKTIKSVVSAIDTAVLGPLVSRGYEFMMRYVEDPDIKGDLRVTPRATLALMTRDAAQIRRNEFMALALQSPVVQQMIGPAGIAALLRATTRTLDLDTQSIVPSDTELRLRMAAIQQAAAQQAQGAGGAPQLKGPTASAELQNGAPVTDNFGA